MWLSSKVFNLFEVAKESVAAMREETASLRIERDTLRDQLNKTQIMNDWFRVQVNTLQYEKTALMERAYNIKLPTPEIIRTPVASEESKLSDFGFDHVDDETAKRLGIAHLLA